MAELKEIHVLSISAPALDILRELKLDYKLNRNSTHLAGATLTLTKEELKEFELIALLAGLVVEEYLLSAVQDVIKYQYLVKIPERSHLR